MKRRPFTAALRDLKARKRWSYQELADGSGVRSSAWFHKQLNGPPRTNTPPAEADWKGFARLLGLEELRVRELIVEEWFELERGERSLPDDVFALAQRLDDMRTKTPNDYELITRLIKRIDGSIRAFDFDVS